MIRAVPPRASWVGVAERLAMSEGTVKVYLHGIYQKVGVENRTSLALLARDSADA